jgi:hypothetical protein
MMVEENPQHLEAAVNPLFSSPSGKRMEILGRNLLFLLLPGLFGKELCVNPVNIYLKTLEIGKL